MSCLTKSDVSLLAININTVAIQIEGDGNTKCNQR